MRTLARLNQNVNHDSVTADFFDEKIGGRMETKNGVFSRGAAREIVVKERQKRKITRG